MQEKVREHRPPNLCYLIRVLTWGREAQTPSDWFRSDSQVKWLVEKKMEADLRSENGQSFCTAPSAASAGVSHWLLSGALRCMDHLGSLNCFCSCSAPLTENPTNLQKNIGEEHAGFSYSWRFVRLHPIKTISWRLAEHSEKDKEGIEIQLRDLSPQLANGDYFSGFLVGQIFSQICLLGLVFPQMHEAGQDGSWRKAGDNPGYLALASLPNSPWVCSYILWRWTGKESAALLRVSQNQRQNKQ